MSDVDLTFDDLIDELATASTVVEMFGPVVVAQASADLVAYAMPLCPVDTYATVSSIGVTTITPLHTSTGPTTFYAPFLEFGTAKMAPRPFMGPATDRVEPEFAEMCAELGASPWTRKQVGYETTTPSGTTYTHYSPLAA